MPARGGVGTRTFHAYDEFTVLDFKAGIAYTMNVG
jgi:hypothetical protein